MRNLSRSRRFIPSVDSLNSRLLLSGTGTVITPMDPVPVGYSDGSDEDPAAASGPTVVVITPMDPVPVGYSDGSDEDPAASGPTEGYANDDTSNAPHPGPRRPPQWETCSCSRPTTPRPIRPMRPPIHPPIQP